MKARALFASLVTVALLSSGCASGPAPVPSESFSAGASDPADPAMDMEMGSRDQPSDPASMICGLEIQDAVQRTFAMKRKPESTPSWSKPKRLFSCTYAVPSGSLAMSVQDSLDETGGRTYFDALRQRLPGATDISGMESFGFPAFETSAGNVVFLKDGKTLHIDASTLSAAELPDGFSREEVAYSVASAVIACWTE